MIKRIIFLFVIVLMACSNEADLSIWDINTDWDKDAVSDTSVTDTSLIQKYYEYACTEVRENVVSVEGLVYYDGDVPDTAKLSIAITVKPPPGVPTCYFTVKTKRFPFGFRFTNIEKDSEVYIMAVLKMDGAAIPIPKEGVDYYGDFGKTPIKLTSDLKDIKIYLKLYKKE
ncbi:MAG: hypothetical protein N2746_11650 [Deltaproteobacteria bacterium]|nr:hypothetical protein [Deltaproteobacteria bacterium]